MKAVFCYLSILRAKQGEFRACRSLSPQAQARMAMLFDIPIPVLRGSKTLDDHLGHCAAGIHHAISHRGGLAFQPGRH